MKIGILTYHRVPNFGAQLQTLSTFLWLKSQGHTPCIVDWQPDDAMSSYRAGIAPEQYRAHEQFLTRRLATSPVLKTERDVEDWLRTSRTEGVLIGSDSLFNVYAPTVSWRHRKRLIPTSDHVFPNPFWGGAAFRAGIPFSAVSVSSQNANFKGPFLSSMKKEMGVAFSRFNYISVRDEWTRQFVNAFTEGRRNPPVTPDPVFALNSVLPPGVSSKEQVLAKFHLPEKYIVMLFFRNGCVSMEKWCRDFERIAAKQGVACVQLPRPQSNVALGLKHAIEKPLDPLDWYNLIRFSSGYVGMLMHPIVISLHNHVPFFSFDHYGVPKLGGLFKNRESSKIFGVLQEAALSDFRCSVRRWFRPPSPQCVWGKLAAFDCGRAKNFAERQQDKCLRNFERAVASLSSPVQEEAGR